LKVGIPFIDEIRLLAMLIRSGSATSGAPSGSVRWVPYYAGIAAELAVWNGTSGWDPLYELSHSGRHGALPQAWRILIALLADRRRDFCVRDIGAIC
jgi:hypothetical protein